MRWFSKEDRFQINLGDFNFAQKHRGKKPKSADNRIPVKLTRQHRVSKTGEVFHLTGRITPIVARFKLDTKSL